MIWFFFSGEWWLRIVRWWHCRRRCRGRCSWRRGGTCRTSATRGTSSTWFPGNSLVLRVHFLLLSGSTTTTCCAGKLRHPSSCCAGRLTRPRHWVTSKGIITEALRTVIAKFVLEAYIVFNISPASCFIQCWNISFKLLRCWRRICNGWFMMPLHCITSAHEWHCGIAIKRIRQFT